MLTILFVEQNIGLITALAQRAYAMDKGRVVAELDSTQVKDRNFLVKYLAL